MSESSSNQFLDYLQDCSLSSIKLLSQVIKQSFEGKVVSWVGKLIQSRSSFSVFQMETQTIHFLPPLIKLVYPSDFHSVKSSSVAQINQCYRFFGKIQPFTGSFKLLYCPPQTPDLDYSFESWMAHLAQAMFTLSSVRFNVSWQSSVIVLRGTIPLPLSSLLDKKSSRIPFSVSQYPDGSLSCWHDSVILDILPESKIYTTLISLLTDSSSKTLELLVTGELLSTGLTHTIRVVNLEQAGDSPAQSTSPPPGKPSSNTAFFSFNPETSGLQPYLSQAWRETVTPYPTSTTTTASLPDFIFRPQLRTPTPPPANSPPKQSDSRSSPKQSRSRSPPVADMLRHERKQNFICPLSQKVRKLNRSLHFSFFLSLPLSLPSSTFL